MRFTKGWLAVAFLAITAAGCANMQASRPEGQRKAPTRLSTEARIERLEKELSQRPKLPEDTAQRLDRLEAEVKAVRKSFADSNFTLENLFERFEALESFVKEFDQHMSRIQKRGGDVDKALENLANKLEAEVRQMGEKVKKMMEEER